jgi:hypothetical protein
MLTSKVYSLEAQLVLAIAREVVTGRRDEVLAELVRRPGLLWGKVKDLLAYHGLGAFACVTLKEYFPRIPVEVVKILEATYVAGLRRMVFFEEQFFALSAAYQAAGIVMIPFKGIALLEDLYAACPVRMSADIDVLIQKKDIDAAITVMKSLGFVKKLCGLTEEYWRRQYHIEFIKPKPERTPLIVEVHWDIDYPRAGVDLLPDKFARLRDLAVGARSSSGGLVRVDCLVATLDVR